MTDVKLPIPDGTNSWLQGMYACDLARSLRLLRMAVLKKGRLTDTLPRIFCGYQFKNSTYHSHHGTWDRLAE